MRVHISFHFLQEKNKSLNDDEDDDLQTSTPLGLPFADDVTIIADDAINALRDSIIVTRTRKVTSKSLDINFIHDHIQSRSCKNTVSLNIVIDI